jgi:hypothetical protein
MIDEEVETVMNKLNHRFRKALTIKHLMKYDSNYYDQNNAVQNAYDVLPDSFKAGTMTSELLDRLHPCCHHLELMP